MASPLTPSRETRTPASRRLGLPPGEKVPGFAWKEYPALPRGTPLRAAVLHMLDDGKWHSLCEIYQAVESAVPAWVAVRTYLARYKGKQRACREAKSFIFKVLAGRKRAIYRCLHRLTSTGVVQSGEGRDWDRQYRLASVALG